MPKPHRNTPERALMLVRRRVEQNYRSGTPRTDTPNIHTASIPGGGRRRKLRECAR